LGYEVTKRTPLYQQHVAAGGKLVDFAGWEMPVNYGSQIAEHNAVRSAAGMFDVSHMTILDVAGADSEAFLRRVVANDVAKLVSGAALYGALLNPAGGVIDDLIVYHLGDKYRCVVNASTRDKVVAWFAQHALADMAVTEQDEAMIAVQGPQAVAVSAEVIGARDLQSLEPFHAVRQDDMLIGRTGYTGEDGIEVMLPADQAAALWERLAAAGVVPAGLGARDTLRLEAGLNLYGQDLDEETSPLASNIGWTIAWDPSDRDFIGRAAIEPERGQCPLKLTGLLMTDKGVLRHGQTVLTDAGPGIITSGTFSPTLQCSVGLARVPRAAKGACEVDIRGKKKVAKIVRPPFVRNGKVLVA
jgi:aminomethyltransferase